MSGACISSVKTSLPHQFSKQNSPEFEKSPLASKIDGLPYPKIFSKSGRLENQTHISKKAFLCFSDMGRAKVGQKNVLTC